MQQNASCTLMSYCEKSLMEGEVKSIKRIVIMWDYQAYQIFPMEQSNDNMKLVALHIYTVTMHGTLENKNDLKKFFTFII